MLNPEASTEYKKKYWHDLLLVMIGALSALLGGSISSYIQGDVTRKQLVLDRKISTLKEYSASYHQAAYKSLASIRQNIYELQIMQINGSLKSAAVDEAIKESIKSYSDTMNLAANVTTQGMMVYALFSEAAPPKPFMTQSITSGHDSEFSKRLAQAKSHKEAIAILIREFFKMEASVTENIEAHNKSIEQLALIIKKEL